MDNLNFKHLFYFYVIAKEGSIKAASERLHVSQPTISDQLKLIESYLECKLFSRKNRGLFLTQEGTLALEYAEKIFSISTEMTQSLRNKVRLPKKCIDIGISHQMSHYFVYENLTPLFSQSEVSINIRQDDRRYLLADLEEGKIDLVFTDTKESLSKNMSAFRVGINRTFIVAHKKFKSLKKGFPESLNHAPFFNYTQNSFLRYEIELFFAKNNLTPQVIGEGDDIDIFDLITKQGLAFTIVPEVAKNRLCLNKNIIAIGEIEDLQTSVWGVIQKSYKGLGYQLIKNHI